MSQAFLRHSRRNAGADEGLWQILHGFKDEFLALSPGEATIGGDLFLQFLQLAPGGGVLGLPEPGRNVRWALLAGEFGEGFRETPGLRVRDLVLLFVFDHCFSTPLHRIVTMPYHREEPDERPPGRCFGVTKLPSRQTNRHPAFRGSSQASRNPASKRARRGWNDKSSSIWVQAAKCMPGGKSPLAHHSGIVVSTSRLMY